MRAVQTWLEWADFLFPGLATGNHCLGSCSTSAKQNCRDLCFPMYMPTVMQDIENRRDNLGLALLGQLIVISCRCLTGDVCGSFVGMIIFVAGNNARCSLKASNLTSFVVLATSLGTFDGLSLLRGLWTSGTSFFMLPFEEHVLLDLHAISLLVAPISEIYGACIAWESYLNPSMLFGIHGGAPHCMVPMASHNSVFGVPPALRHPSQLLVHAGAAWPQGFLQDGSVHGTPFFAPSDLYGSGPSAPHTSSETGAPPSMPPSTPPHAGRQSRGMAISPIAMGIMAGTGGADEEHCFECGQVVRHNSEGWCGTGTHSQILYCRKCWASWSVMER